MYVLYIYHRADGVYIRGFYFFALVSKLAILFSYVKFFFKDYLMLLYLGLSYNVFILFLLMLQGHHLGYITFSIQIKMDMAEPFCCCTEAKPVNLRVPASERQPPRLPHWCLQSRFSVHV